VGYLGWGHGCLPLSCLFQERFWICLHHCHPVLGILPVFIGLPLCSCSIIVSCPVSSGTHNWYWLSGSVYFHSPLCHTGLMRYQKHFSGTSAPPVAHSSPAQSHRESCMHSAMSPMLFMGEVMQGLTSSMKPNPVRRHLYKEIVQITITRKPSSMRIWKSSELTTAHICGPALLPWPMLAMGVPTVVSPGILLNRHNLTLHDVAFHGL